MRESEVVYTCWEHEVERTDLGARTVSAVWKPSLLGSGGVVTLLSQGCVRTFFVSDG